MKVYQEDQNGSATAAATTARENPTSIQQEETDILTKTGISIMDEKPAREVGVLPGTIPRRDVMSGIQNPPKIEARKLNDIPKPMAKEIENTAEMAQAPQTPASTIPVPKPPIPVSNPANPISDIPIPPIKPVVPAAPIPPQASIPAMPTPPLAPKPNMIDQKLAGATASVGTTSAYVPLSSVKMPTPPQAPKPEAPTETTPANPPKGGDTYREPIE